MHKTNTSTESQRNHCVCKHNHPDQLLLIYTFSFSTQPKILRAPQGSCVWARFPRDNGEAPGYDEPANMSFSYRTCAESILFRKLQSIINV